MRTTPIQATEEDRDALRRARPNSIRRYARLILPGAVAGLLATATAHARTLRVAQDGSGDYGSIGAAMQVSVHGDIIEVAPGTYHERLRFGGRAITVRSLEGPEVTVIDGDDQASVVVMDFLEGPSSVLDGFTLCHGLGTPVRATTDPAADQIVDRREELSGEESTRGRLGGGLLLLTAAPTLRNLIVRDNRAEIGGGLFSMQVSPHLENCRFFKNLAGLGAGAYLEMTDGAVFKGCEFRSNLGVVGGGIALLQGSAYLDGCRFAENQAAEGSALQLRDCAEPTLVRGSIFERNQGVEGSVALAFASILNLESCTAAGNGFPGELSAALLYRNGSSGTITRSIIAVRRNDRALRIDQSNLEVDCSDLWSEGDPLSAPFGNNLAVPPGFCDEAAGDLRLRHGSSCLPPQAPPGCGLIGALGEGCAGSSSGGGLRE